MFGHTETILAALGPRTHHQRRTDNWMVGDYLSKTSPLQYVQLVQEAKEAALDEAARKLGINKQ